MLGLDTNVLVRFLVQDDQAQFERAQKLIGRELRTGSGVLISLLVLLETEWVLRSRYSLAKSEILAAFSGLLASAELRFEDEHSIEEALSRVPRALMLTMLVGAYGESAAAQG